jgi:short-subunit dehydrogenase
MKKTIAIIGAGIGVGLAVAERFGREGYNIALLARSTEKLEALKESLLKKGIQAATFQTDILDRENLTRSLQEVADTYGSIDVLEFSPSPAWETLRTPRNIDVENEQFHLDFQVLSAITAVRAVLPKMLERKEGSILFTTAASAQYPNYITASFGVAAGALLNYARLLNMDLAQNNIYTGIVSIGAIVVGDDIPAKGEFPEGLPTIKVEEVADAHWRLHEKRDVVEIILGDVESLSKVPGFK